MKINMKSSVFYNKKSNLIGKKTSVFLVACFYILTFIFLPIYQVKAQYETPLSAGNIMEKTVDNYIDAAAAGAGAPVTDIGLKISNFVDKLMKSAGSLIFQQTLSATLNKIAYDTANWIGSGGQGQKPLFVTEGWPAYMARIGDEAAGTYLEKFSANWAVNEGNGVSFNFCQPSSLDVKVRIGLGLANGLRPQGPNCTATQMIANWSSAAQKYADYNDPQFLNKFVNVFNPTSNDVGIYFLNENLINQEQQKAISDARTQLLGKEGWLDKLKIDGNPITAPGAAKSELDNAQSIRLANFGKYTGDVFVDAANLFINELAISSFNKLVRNLAERRPANSNISANFSDGFNLDPNTSGGQTQLSERTVKLIQPNFSVKADYSVLSELSICLNKDNPSPNNCVIDSKFMQAISEQKTVGEALKEGYLNGNWQFVINGDGSSYENNFSWRNVSILRKYRIVPASWELVFEKLEQLKIGANQNVSNVEEKFATLKDLVSCFSPYDSYNDFSSEFDANDQAWCTNLVDPNWVLKAPLNFCAKEGVGAHINSIFTIPAQNYGQYVPSYLSLIREDKYCADNQTCIRESADGSCQTYGYCNEEKRIWHFDGDSCEPINNTCQTFINPDTKSEVSYLENTLDYTDCSADNAGCKQYSNSGSFNGVTGTVTWNDAGSLYLNNKTEGCSAADEGCSELIRIKSSGKANLVMNSSFSNDQIGASSTTSVLNDWPLGPEISRATIVDSALEPGGNSGKAIKLEGSPALLYSDGDDANFSLVPKNFEILEGRSYTVSADVYLSAGSKTIIAIGSGNARATYESTTRGYWHHISVTKQAGEGFNSPSFSIAAEGAAAILYVKDLKFEMSPWDTGYSSYGSIKSYQKLLPNYLEAACYVGETAAGYNYQLRPDAPMQCYNYTRRCDRGEVGCELYRSARNNFAIPAKVADSDYCPKECVGYDVYIAKETSFSSAQAENLIPSTATQCTASAAGCMEFTNLDDSQIGGEQREYYSQLKHCVKPEQASCTDFYYWEGTGTGYQLNTQSLEVNTSGGPKTIKDDSSLCNETIFKAAITSPDYNPDCRQYYNASGQIFYHLTSYTITCSSDCRSYRLTERNFNRTISSAECVGTDRKWDNQEGACILCLSGGVWNETHNSCVYQGIPGEGKVCNASQNGCREYNGSAGNNVRLVSAYDFESSSPAWTSNCINGVERVTVSNTQGGHSLLYNSNAAGCSELGTELAAVAKNIPLIKEIFAGDNQAAQLKVSTSVAQNKAYNVKFWANSAAGTELSMYFLNPDTDARASFNDGKSLTIAGGGGWQLYSVNLDNLDHSVSANEVLILTANNDFYLDNFILTEITDRYYLIKASSKIPDICYYDILDVYRGPDYNLGCTAYTDRAGSAHNLHSFSNICASSSVGCEQVIDTNNYQPYQAGIWNDKNDNQVCDVSEPDCVAVAADTAMYVVYDASKQCSAANLGCSRLGQAMAGTNASVFSDVFKKNNPNSYDNIVCAQDFVGCEAWSRLDGNGFSYFRDPGTDVCVYRLGTSQSGASQAWYKAAVKRCDANNDGKISGPEQNTSICASDTDCNNQSCILDNNDYLCSSSNLETIGYGGPGKEVPVPTSQAGLCAPEASGCQEYIDPVSQFNPNLAALSPISLQPNKLYLLTFADSSHTADFNLTFTANIAPLLTNNTFGPLTKTASINSAKRFYIFNSLSNTSILSISHNPDLIILRELAVNYQLNSSVDKQSCSGLVDFDNGCVLFNARTFSGETGYTSLADAYNPYVNDGKQKSLVQCNDSDPSTCAANQLIKVRPDRVCASWFDCSTYIYDEVSGEKICYSMEQCNSLDDKGECNNFISGYEPNLLNATGYHLLGKNSIGSMRELGLNSNLHIDFEELIPAISCVRKDVTVQNKACNFNNNIIKDLLVREPEGSPADYPASGKSYLRIPAAFKISPLAEGDYISLSPGQDYFFSYLLSTQNSSGEITVALEFKGGSSASATSSLVFQASSLNGWSRQIHRFSTGGNTSSGDVQVRVFFYTSGDASTASDGEVYVDDINIEPVLGLGEDEYTARECRLYPESGSLTCQSQTSTASKQGLEGYCLERDKTKSKTCLTWYPVDRISSSRLGTNGLGYSGPAGLSYCTKINSNIEFAKKVTTKLVLAYKDESDNGFGGFIPGIEHDYCGISSSPMYCDTICGGCDYYKALVLNDELNWKYEYIYCIPNDDSDNFLFPVGTEKKIKFLSHIPEDDPNCSFLSYYESAWMKYDGTMIQATAPCNSSDCSYIDEYNNANPPIRIYNSDYPAIDEAGLQLLATDPSSVSSVFNFSCSEFDQRVSTSGDNKAWVVRTGLAANPAYSTTTPPFFVTNPVTNLQLYGRQRNGIPFGAATFPWNYDLLNSGPIFLQNQYYQRNNNSFFAGRPYGCTGSSCDKVGYCSENPNVFCVYSPTEDSTINVTIEECDSDADCQSVGIGSTCSMDMNKDICVAKDGVDWDTPLPNSPFPPNNSCSVLTHDQCQSYPDYCELINIIYGTCSQSTEPTINKSTYINIKTCSDGGFGVCRPLWKVTNNKVEAASVLNEIFKKSYGTFKYSEGSYIPAAPSLPSYFNTNTAGVAPVITNVNLYKLGTTTPVTTIALNELGVYELKFNIRVNPEQQPLKMIYIDWGDGKKQAFTGLDNKSDERSPHKFYHYYTTTKSSAIMIRAWDNWDSNALWSQR